MSHVSEDSRQPIGSPWWGPIPVQSWLKNWAPRTSKSKKQPFASLPLNIERVGSIDRLVATITKNSLCESVFVHNTHYFEGTDPAGKDGIGISPSIVFSADESFPRTADGVRLDRMAASCEMFFDITIPCKTEWDLDGDPFDNTPDREDGFDYSTRRRSILMVHANMLFRNGHRTHCFAVVIMDKNARLVRLDRSGGAYSDLFDWRKTATLANFIRAFDEMTPEERGWDPSVERLAKDSPEVAEAWKIASMEADKVLPPNLGLSDVIPDPTNELRSLSLIHVYDQSSSKIHRLVVDKPHIQTSRGLEGRGSRGFLAVDLDEKTIFYLKDTWRYTGVSLKESATYETLLAHGVPHLPGYLMGGDVPVDWRKASNPGRKGRVRFQSTNNRDVWWEAYEEQRAKLSKEEQSKEESSMLLYSYIHHRVVLRDIGAPLDHFKNTRELVVAVRDALEAHHYAAKDAKILHRDISAGNVMIDRNGRGILIDWELAAPYTDDASSIRRRSCVVGTETHMSVNILKADGVNPRPHLHVAADDMESLLHVLSSTFLSCRPFTRYKPPEDWHTMVEHCWDGNERHTFDRMDYLRDDGSFDGESLTRYVRPKILAHLIRQLRAVFSLIYRHFFVYDVNDWERIVEEKRAAEEDLKDGQRLLAIFQKYLDSRKCGAWPKGDASIKRPEPKNSSPRKLRGRKRKAEVTNATEDDLPRKRWRIGAKPNAQMLQEP